MSGPADLAGEMVIARLEKLLRRLATRKQVRHAIVGAAAMDGSWSWADAVGAATPAGVPMRVETPWFLASVTKLHIAAVTLRLHERGMIDLRAPISAYLPAELATGLHVYDGVDYTDRITATHLLGHLSGLPDYLDKPGDGGRGLIDEILEEGDRSWSPEEAVTRARDRLTPYFPPSDPQATRAKIRYSDTNYQLLVVIAQRVAGKSMSHIYRELLLEPLGLRDTWLPGAEPEGHTTDPATVWIGGRTLEDRPLAMQSFGDMYSTVGDVLRFGDALFGGELFDDAATGRLMWGRFRRFGFPRSVASLQAPSWPIEYSLGAMRFALSRLLAGGMRLPPVIGHTGSTGSWLWFVPSLALLVAGTVDQAGAATVPFRLVPRSLAGLTA